MIEEAVAALSEKDTLPPTAPDVLAPQGRPGGAHDEPTLPAAQSGGQPPERQKEVALWPDAPEEDRTVLIGHEEAAKPVLAWLVVTAGGPVGKLFTLNPEITSIGRDRQNDIVLDDDACSSRHAKLKVEVEEGAEKFHLLDLASTNGTFVNGEQIYRHPLVDGDRVTIGETELVFKKV